MRYIWNVMLFGHGIREKEGDDWSIDKAKIAALTVSQFSELLKFFENSIDVVNFYYDTCYAGGYHFTVPYKDCLALSFNVISGGTIDDITYTRVRTNWQKVLDLLLLAETIWDYKRVLSELIEYDKGNYNSIYNIKYAMIRMFREDCFKVIPGVNESVFFPHELTGLYSKDTKDVFREGILFLDSPHIVDVIYINKITRIISISFGPCIHILHTVNCHKRPYNEILNYLFLFRKDPKLFIIRDLKCSDGEYENVCIGCDDSCHGDRLHLMDMVGKYLHKAKKFEGCTDAYLGGTAEELRGTLEKMLFGGRSDNI